MVNCCTRGDLGSILRVGVMTSFSLIRGDECSLESILGEDNLSSRVSANNKGIYFLIQIKNQD